MGKDYKTARQRKRQELKPFTLHILLKHGGKKISTYKAEFQPRESRGISEKIKRAVDEILKEI